MRKLCIVILLLTFASVYAKRTEPWPKERSWQWYNHQPWIRGINYVGSDCVSWTEFWQNKGFDSRIENLKIELSKAKELGFNAVSLTIDNGVSGNKGFIQLFDKTLSLLDSYGIRAVVTLQDIHILSKYREDKRILMWYLENADENLFRLAWEIDPIQPLSSSVDELSDVITYQSFAPLSSHISVCAKLSENYGKPIICTQWLSRIEDCNIYDIYPFFQQQRIGNMIQGFVAGKSMQYEPSQTMWENGKNLKLWNHDLLRSSLRPYDPVETEIIKRVNLQADIEDSLVISMTVRQIIASKFKILSQDMWYGFRRTKFRFHDWTAWVVEPSVNPMEGKPWTWTMQWAESFVDRTGVLDLLKQGFHHVTVEAFDRRADDQSLEYFAEFQKFLVDELHFSPKANLVGMSWGGFFSIRYSTAYPENINKIYLDAPLLVFKNWNTPTHDYIGPWADSVPDDWNADPRMPLNMAEKLAVYKIPILLLYGGQDQTVDPKLNCEKFVTRYRSAGGEIDVHCRGGYGHHPHGEDPGRTNLISDFFLGK